MNYLNLMVTNILYIFHEIYYFKYNDLCKIQKLKFQR